MWRSLSHNINSIFHKLRQTCQSRARGVPEIICTESSRCTCIIHHKLVVILTSDTFCLESWICTCSTKSTNAFIGNRSPGWNDLIAVAAWRSEALIAKGVLLEFFFDIDIMKIRLSLCIFFMKVGSRFFKRNWRNQCRYSWYEERNELFRSSLLKDKHGWKQLEYF